MRRQWRSVFLAALVTLVAFAAAAADFPRDARLAAGDGFVAGGCQISVGDNNAFELFTAAPDGADIRRLGRYNGRLAGVAVDGEGRLLALTRDGSLAVYGDDPSTLCLPDSRWHMLDLAWWQGAPVAANLDNGALSLVRPIDGSGWTAEAEAATATLPLRSVSQVRLVPDGDALHLLWYETADDLSRGVINHLVLRDGRWQEAPPLPMGQPGAFTAYIADGRLTAAARIPDPMGAAEDRVLRRAMRDGIWRDAPVTPEVWRMLSPAHSFAAVRQGQATVWLSTGREGAHLRANDGTTVPVLPGAAAESLWARFAGHAMLIAFLILLAVNCQRSRAMSRLFPGRVPDIISRGTALAIDWLLSVVVTAVYHIASGDIYILPELITGQNVVELFWINLLALCLIAGISEGAFGTSPGKWLAGLRIRNAAGGRPTFLQAMLRNTMRAADMFPTAGFPGLVGFLVILFRRDGRRLGDIVAGTVVRRYADPAGRRFLLASASPRREELLRALGVEMRVQAADIDEEAVNSLTPEDTVMQRSLAKARAVMNEAKGGEIIIAADTVVVLDGVVLGKPLDADNARGMLGRLSGRSHTVFTGVTVWSSATGQGVTDVEETEVEFRPLSEGEIAAYVATGDPMDKAGGYGVQTANLVKQVRGSLSNVAGLPMEKLQTMVALLD